MKIPKIPIDRSLTRTIFSSALFSYILSSLASAVGPMVDGSVIGNFLGIDAVEAYGMVWPAILIFALIGAVIAGGARNLYTNLVGQGNLADANGVFTVAQILNLLLSVPMVVVIWLFPEQIAELLGARGSAEHLKPLIGDYLRGISLGIPVMNAAKILSSFMPVDSDAGRNVVAMACMTVVDVIADLLVVLVLQGSMLGIGLATSAGNLVQFVILSLHFLRKNRILRYSFRKLSRHAGAVWEIIANGAPSGTTRLASSIGGLIINYILVSYAAGEFIAAYSVQKSVISLVNCIYLGVADTVWTLSSVYYGEEDRSALRSLQHNAFWMGENITIVVGLVLFIFAPFFARIYLSTDNAFAMELAVEAVRVFAVSMPLNLVAYTFIDYLIGTRHLMAANVYGYFLECGIIAPNVWILVMLIGGRGVWFASLLSLNVIVMAQGFFIRWHSHGNSFDEKRLLLRKGFGTESGRELGISATSLEEIIGMSRLSGLFCRENGIGEKQAFYLALCVEEMAVNILRHGYTGRASRIKPQIDIRFLIKDDEVILRIRDNGLPFNPVERYEMMQEQPSDPGKNLGIRLVMKMSRDVQYYNINRTNNLIIRI